MVNATLTKLLTKISSSNDKAQTQGTEEDENPSSFLSEGN